MEEEQLQLLKYIQCHGIGLVSSDSGVVFDSVFANASAFGMI